MKSLAATFWGLLHLVGCSVGRPSDAEIDSIEAITTHNACTGSLTRWHREYAFQKRGVAIDRDFISVWYIEAGHRGLPAGRFSIEPPRGYPPIDDTQHRVAGGEFDRQTGRFVTWMCGCNRGPYNVSYQIECAGKRRTI
ncbi:hypothetical protein ASE00_05025 [Sphingomonas sp. Root710]|uniref:hypothetical protein n=1 Tax=Sphingomonas sp. Root710 TaxID=1736594 RepID=UPI0006F2BCBF|nr:hypothetical protein [Sphingomonas sp. Root710]KRB86105.1 hypothetical protein ASE00_05025 [Sphingomonas sp. Root710]